MVASVMHRCAGFYGFGVIIIGDNQIVIVFQKLNIVIPI